MQASDGRRPALWVGVSQHPAGARVRRAARGGLVAAATLAGAAHADAGGAPARVTATLAGAQAPPDDDGHAVFSVRSSGEHRPELAREVLGVLRAADREYRDRLGFGPREAVHVMLDNATVPDEPDGMPRWADGLYDGGIRVPTVGVESLTPRLTAVLRHELAHSFVHARTRGNCPAWLQEGVAQWLEGGAPEREDPVLAELARIGELPALVTLEAPFADRPESAVRSAYAASLSAAAHLIRVRGVAGLRRLLESLGAGLPSEEALPNALGLSYPQLQRSWEAHLNDLAPSGNANGSANGSGG